MDHLRHRSARKSRQCRQHHLGPDLDPGQHRVLPRRHLRDAEDKKAFPAARSHLGPHIRYYWSSQWHNQFRNTQHIWVK